MKVKLLRTIQNRRGDIFRKGSIVYAKKSYGGYELWKRKRRKNGCIIAVTRVPETDFRTVKQNSK